MSTISNLKEKHALDQKGMNRTETKFLMKQVLSAYAKTGIIGSACDGAGVPRSYHSYWMKTYPRYVELFNELRERFVDSIESVAIDRAKGGSDSMLQFMLKAHRREVYGDKSDVNLNAGTGIAPITLVFAEGMLNPTEKKLIEDASGNKMIEAGHLLEGGKE